MSKLDLTVREVNEAQTYGLSSDQYDELKDKFTKRSRESLRNEVLDQAKKEAKTELRTQIDIEVRPLIKVAVERDLRPILATEIEKELRSKLPDELQPKLREALLPEVRKQVESEIGEKLRQEARTAIEQEIAQQVPTNKERAALQEFVRDAEVDCMTQAHAASNDADAAEQSLKWSRRTRVPVAYALILGLPILAFFLYHRFVFTEGFWAFLAPAVVAAIAFASAVSGRHEKLTMTSTETRKSASAYWRLASQAKKLRMVTATSAQTRGTLREELNRFTSSKETLDEHYSPAVKSLEQSRIEVREQLLSDVDPEKLLRVADDDEESEEAQTVSPGMSARR